MTREKASAAYSSQTLTVRKSNDAVTPEAVLKIARDAAEKETKATGTTATSAFIHRSEAQKEADRRNLAAQAMIGAK